MRIEIPDQGEWVYGSAICGIRRLKNHENRYSVDRVLKASTQKARPTWRRDDPAVTKARGPDAGVLRNSIRSVPPRRPKFNLIAIRLRPILGAQRRNGTGEKQSAGKEQNSNGLNK